jgi:hypothetical protein
MQTIAPLLRIRPGEVLVNFMTGHIRRFIESPQKQTRDSFKRLFGSDEFTEKLKGLEKLDREDALIGAYCDSVRKFGNFPYVSCAVVLHPGRNRTHFHLIYASRDPRGVQVFKAAEKKAMPLMEMKRAGVQERAEVKRIGHKQLGFEYADEVENKPSEYFLSLRQHHVARARAVALRLLQEKKNVFYDAVWTLVMSFPLVWEVDLKGWISEWKQEGSLQVKGMKGGQRVPKIGRRFVLCG